MLFSITTKLHEHTSTAKALSSWRREEGTMKCLLFYFFFCSHSSYIPATRSFGCCQFFKMLLGQEPVLEIISMVIHFKQDTHCSRDTKENLLQSSLLCKCSSITMIAIRTYCIAHNYIHSRRKKIS